MRALPLLTTATAEFLKGATHIQLAGCNADCGRLEVKLQHEDAWRAVTSRNWTRADAKTGNQCLTRAISFRQSPPQFLVSRL